MLTDKSVPPATINSQHYNKSFYLQNANALQVQSTKIKASNVKLVI